MLDIPRDKTDWFLVEPDTAAFAQALSEVRSVADALEDLGFAPIGALRTQRDPQYRLEDDAPDYLREVVAHTRDGTLVSVCFASREGTELAHVDVGFDEIVSFETIFQDGTVHCTSRYPTAALVTYMEQWLEPEPDSRAWFDHTTDSVAEALARHREALRRSASAPGVLRTLRDALLVRRVVHRHAIAAGNARARRLMTSMRDPALDASLRSSQILGVVVPVCCLAGSVYAAWSSGSWFWIAIALPTLPLLWVSVNGPRASSLPPHFAALTLDQMRALPEVSRRADGAHAPWRDEADDWYDAVEADMKRLGHPGGAAT